MIKRRVDSFGRIVVPKEMREAMNMSNGTVIDISIVEDGILIRRGEGVCRVCGGECDKKNLFHICGGCMEEIRNSQAE